MPNNQEHPSFDDFVLHNRFAGSNVWKDFEGVVETLTHSRSMRTEVVLVRSPYPGLDDSDIDEDDAASAGLGAGKTDFVQIAAEHLHQQSFTVLAFKELRRRTEEFDNFYVDVFLEEVFKNHHGRLISSRKKVRYWTEMAWSRFSLLISIAWPMFGAAIFALLGVLSFRAFEFFVDPQNAGRWQQVLNFFNSYQQWFLLAGVVFLVIWIASAWGQFQQKEELRERWEELGTNYAKSISRAGVIERISHQAEAVLASLPKNNSQLALLLDDIDAIDEGSCRKLLRLIDAARESHACKLLALFTFNPSNRSPKQIDRQWAAREFAVARVNEQGWKQIELRAITKAQLTNFLWAYYRHEKAERLQRHLESNFAEAEYNTGLLLAFFRAIDKQPNRPETLLVAPESIIGDEFRKFLERERRTVTEILNSIDSIAEQDSEVCRETLKYILAHRAGYGLRRVIRVENFLALPREVTKDKAERSLQLLASEQLNLLRIVDSDGYGRRIEFRRGYTYTILSTGWQEWRQDARRYYTDVLHHLHATNPKKREDDAELALRSLPSKLAVDILWRTGEYHFRFAGASPLRTALRYYTEALERLLKLLEDAWRQDDDIWNVVLRNEWKSSKERSNIRPLFGWSNEPYNVLRYGNDLLIFHLIYVVGRLYWLTGTPQKAKLLWSQQWPEIHGRLSQNATKPQHSAKLRWADYEIQVAYVEMLYNLGDWDEAKRISSLLPTIDWERATRTNAGVYSALIEHYREVGPGNLFPDFRFLNSTGQLRSLLVLSSDEGLVTVDRLRLLNACADGYWQIIEGSVPDLREIELLRDYKRDFDQSAWNSLTDVLSRQARTLDLVAKNRLKRRDSWVLWPDARSEDAWFLLWEGYYLLYRCYDFRVTVMMGYMDLYATLQDTSPYPDRIDALLTIAHTTRRYLENHYAQYLHTNEKVSSLYDKIDSSAHNPSAKKSSEQRRHFENLRKRVEEFFSEVNSIILGEASRRMRYAEVAFRELGHQPGILASIIGKSRILKANSSNVAIGAGVGPAWLNELGRYFRDIDGSLGYHLDNFLAHVAAGLWTEQHDLPRASNEFLHALGWVDQHVLGLPTVLGGEISYHVGQVLGNGEQMSQRPMDILPYFERAKVVFESKDGQPQIIGEQFVVDRRIMAAWWMAELSMRHAQSIPIPNERERWLKRVDAYSDAVIKQAKRHEEKARVRNLARLVKGRALEQLGRAKDAYAQYRIACDYFIEQGDQDNAMQSLMSLVQLTVYQNIKENDWKKNRSETQEKYLPRLVRAVENYAANLEQLSYISKLLLFRASRVLGKMPWESAEASIHWLEISLSTLENLGLYGTAISLNPLLRERYQRLPDPQRLSLHQKRILTALQRLDPTCDIVPNPEWFSDILLDLKLNSIFSQTEHLTTKEELVKAAQNALANENPDTEGAVRLLENAQNLRVESNVEEIDFTVLEMLRSVYYKLADTANAQRVTDSLQRSRSIARCCALYEIAMYFKGKGTEYEGFLRSATIETIDCECFNRAIIELDLMLRRQVSDLDAQKHD